MFGYICADKQSLTPQQLARYRGCYCGLCRALGARCGQVCRGALTYDMVFLTLLLSSLYEPSETVERRPCPAHPFRRVVSWRSDASDYAADLNILLARLNCLDDWQDERSLPRLLEAGLFRRGAEAAAARQPEQWRVIRDSLGDLRAAEEARDPSPDRGANAFGRLMGSLFCWREDRWKPLLAALGMSLGRFIYLLDAWDDRPKDEKRGRYNPLSAMVRQGATPAELQNILLALMAEGAAAWEKLPLVQDIDIQRNILYTGVWSKFITAQGDST